MKQTQRHDAIIELVKKQGYVSTEELVEQFAVSPQTIRRDLNDLADQNRIRHHGGRRCRPARSTPPGTTVKRRRRRKKAHCPQGRQPDPERGDAVY
jgi:DeoR/GlpR family transcriptional regulator of sugar metabolism